jgi:DNA-directed RNA polymerase specialized sigma24 family protein
MSTPNRWRRNYSDAEIRELVEGYEELREVKETGTRRGLLVLVKLADLDKALRSLTPREYEAVILCGMIGLTMRTSGQLLAVSAQTMSNRYNRGLSSLARYLNGGT